MSSNAKTESRALENASDRPASAGSEPAQRRRRDRKAKGRTNSEQIVDGQDIGTAQLPEESRKSENQRNIDNGRKANDKQNPEANKRLDNKQRLNNAEKIDNDRDVSGEMTINGREVPKGPKALNSGSKTDKKKAVADADSNPKSSAPSASVTGTNIVDQRGSKVQEQTKVEGRLSELLKPSDGSKSDASEQPGDQASSNKKKKNKKKNKSSQTNVADDEWQEIIVNGAVTAEASADDMKTVSNGRKSDVKANPVQKTPVDQMIRDLLTEVKSIEHNQSPASHTAPPPQNRSGKAGTSAKQEIADQYKHAGHEEVMDPWSAHDLRTKFEDAATRAARLTQVYSSTSGEYQIFARLRAALQLGEVTPSQIARQVAPVEFLTAVMLAEEYAFAAPTLKPKNAALRQAHDELLTLPRADPPSQWPEWLPQSGAPGFEIIKAYAEGIKHGLKQSGHP